MTIDRTNNPPIAASFDTPATLAAKIMSNCTITVDNNPEASKAVTNHVHNFMENVVCIPEEENQKKIYKQYNEAGKKAILQLNDYLKTHKTITQPEMNVINRLEKKFNSTARLKSKVKAKNYKNLAAAMSKDIDYGINNISERVHIAEQRKCHPKDVTDKMLDEKLVKKADDLMQELIEQEEKEKKAKKIQITKQPVRKKLPNKNAKTSSPQIQNNQCKKPITSVINTPSKSIDNVNKTYEAQRVNFALNLSKKIMSCPELSRITRWSTENLINIRPDLKDKDSVGNEVYHYANLSDEEVAKQRARHFLPGTERVLNPIYLQIYSFVTDRGYGIVAQLDFNKTQQNGVVYFGVNKSVTNGLNKSHLIFHKYFENITFIDSKKNCFLDELNNKPEEMPGDWNSNDNFRLEISEKGVLQFIYDTHTLNVFPIRKDLFDAHLAKS